MFTESDVEQKFIYNLLTSSSPVGLDFFPDDVQTKRDIRSFTIGKGTSKKLYFPDYVVVLDGLPTMIIEAKKPQDKDLEEAYREARLYAAEINAAYKTQVNPCSRVIATNGERLIAGFSDSQSYVVDLPIENNAVTNQGFIELLEFANRRKQAEEISKIRSHLRGTAQYTKPVFLLGGNAVINETVGENGFGSNLSLEYQSLFNPETTEEKAEIVTNAYINSKRRESHVAPIDRILRATVPPHQRDAKIIDNTDNPIEIINTLDNTAKLKNELCLLVGGVGAGKSTFTEFLRLKALPQNLVASTRWVNVNLNNAPVSRTEIYSWIVGDLISGIRRKYPKEDFDSLDFLQALYKDELEAVSKGRAALFPPNSTQHLEILSEELGRLQADKVNTLRNLITLLFEKQGLLLVIVLDNCDKRSRDDQLLMFEVAAWMKGTFRSLIFLPLRDTTYDLYSDQPPLDTVIKDLVFRIEAPLLEKVISARMGFLLRKVEASTSSFNFSTENGLTVSCSRNEVFNYMRSVITTLFQDADFKSIIKGLAGRNIRRGLEVVLDFCKSGHISTDQILKMRLSIGEYRLPPHLVYKVLLKGNRRYFSDDKSRLLNVFYSDNNDDLPDPFVRLDILSWLRDNFRKKGPNNSTGYHKVETLIQVMQGIGHSRSRVLLETNALVEKELVMSEGLTKSVDSADLIIITASGFTHFNIFRNINYLSTVAEDTQFRDSSVSKSISDNMVGTGYYRLDSKDASLSTSIQLVDYLANYSEKFFFKNEAMDIVSTWSHTSLIKDLKSFLSTQADKDDQFRSLSKIKFDYKNGSEHLGQIVAIKEYGIFVELSAGLACLVHVSKFGVRPEKVFQDVEEGDDVIVKILEYNLENKRLNAELIQY